MALLFAVALFVLLLVLAVVFLVVIFCLVLHLVRLRLIFFNGELSLPLQEVFKSLVTCNLSRPLSSLLLLILV